MSIQVMKNTMRSVVRGVLVLGAVCGAVACGGPIEDAQMQDPAEAAPSTQAQGVGVGGTCGGFAALQCDAGLVCVDDPSDSCDPNQGGRDCSGICQTDTAQCNNPKRYYVSRDPSVCARIRYTCPPPGAANANKTQFFGDACGCGCEAPR